MAGTSPSVGPFAPPESGAIAVNPTHIVPFHPSLPLVDRLVCVAAELVEAHCDRVQGFHPGQYGCRKGRSAVDAVGVTIAQVQEAWGRGCIVGALLMDVAAAFPSVARGCLLKKMRKARVDECQVR